LKYVFSNIGSGDLTCDGWMVHFTGNGTLGTLLLTLGWNGRHTNGVQCCSVLYRLRVFFACGFMLRYLWRHLVSCV